MTAKRVGVIGGGQLAQMMSPAAEKLGIKLIVQTPSLEDPAAKVADEVVIGAIADAQVTAELASKTDIITFENEFIDKEALKALADKGVCFRPSLAALSPLLDKYLQRQYLRDIGVEVPRFIGKESQNNNNILSPFGFPVVMKSRRHGYDGLGTFIIEDRITLETTYIRLEYPPVVLEEYIEFEKELAVIAARNVAGEIAIYPVVESQQENQVCRRVFAPAKVSETINQQIQALAKTILEKLDYVGVLGIELFLTKQGKVLVNEISPRTHNSGHYTIDACGCSQFEMHLRAVAGLALESPALKATDAVMVNLLGFETAQSDYAQKRTALESLPNSYLHWYGKTESRPGRKLGHITVLDSGDNIQAIAQQIESIWYC